MLFTFWKDRKMRLLASFAFCISTLSAASAEQILYLGHSKDIRYLKKSGDFVLSVDDLNNWTLWDFQKKMPLQNGTVPTLMTLWDIQRNTLVVKQDTALYIYNYPFTSALQVPCTGRESEIKITANGEYIWAKSYTDFKIWDRFGTVKLTILGNYSTSTIASDSSHIYILNPSKDTILVFLFPSFQSQAPITFSGRFNGWLTEGGKFMTTQGEIVRIYSANGANEGMYDIGDVSGLKGCGSYFWTTITGTNSLKMYRIGSSASFLTIKNGGNLVEGTTFLESYYGDTLALYKLGEDSITFYEHNGIDLDLRAFTCDSLGNWVSGNGDGLLIYGQASDSLNSNYLNHGAITSISGASNNKFAVSTASGNIFTYDLSNGHAVPIDTITHRSTAIELTDDATKLFVYNNFNKTQNNELIEYNHPSNEVLRSWECPNADSSVIIGFSISKNGSIVCQTSCDICNGGCITTITYLNSGKVIQIPNGKYHVVPQLSPLGEYSVLQCDDVLKLYRDSILINAFSGKFGGWFDDSTILLNTYQGGNWQSVKLFGVGGNSVPGYTFPEEMLNIQRVSDSMVFYYRIGRINAHSNFKLANIKQGKVIYTVFDSTILHFSACSVGKEHIVYQTHTALESLNWSGMLPLQYHDISTRLYSNRANILVSNGQLRLNFTLLGSESPVVNIIAMNGRQIAKYPLGNLKAGNYDISIPIYRICNITSNCQVIVVIKSKSISYASKLIL